MNTVIKTAFVLIVLVLTVVLAWGFVGGMEVQDPGITCDMGLGERFCWQWHTNTAGKIDEFIDDITDR
jgi:hypothetical protein